MSTVDGVMREAALRYMTIAEQLVIRVGEASKLMEASPGALRVLHLAVTDAVAQMGAAASALRAADEEWASRAD